MKWASCITSLCRTSQDLGSPYAEPFTGLQQEFLGNSEVHQGRVDVLVSELGCQVRKMWLRIDALPVPGQHPIDDEGMTKVMSAGSRASRSGFQLCEL
jgi:hypothetical protein